MVSITEYTHTEWQRPLSGVHSILIEKLAGEGGGCTPTPLTLFTITYKVALYAPAQRTDTLTLLHLYSYVLCGLESRSNIYSPTPITAISEDEWKIKKSSSGSFIRTYSANPAQQSSVMLHRKDTVLDYVDWQACTATPLSGVSWQYGSSNTSATGDVSLDGACCSLY